MSFAAGSKFTPMGGYNSMPNGHTQLGASTPHPVEALRPSASGIITTKGKIIFVHPKTSQQSFQDPRDAEADIKTAVRPGAHLLRHGSSMLVPGQVDCIQHVHIKAQGGVPYYFPHTSGAPALTAYQAGGIATLQTEPGLHGAEALDSIIVAGNNVMADYRWITSAIVEAHMLAMPAQYSTRYNEQAQKNMYPVAYVITPMVRNIVEDDFHNKDHFGFGTIFEQLQVSSKRLSEEAEKLGRTSSSLSAPTTMWRGDGLVKLLDDEWSIIESPAGQSSKSLMFSNVEHKDQFKLNISSAEANMTFIALRKRVASLVRETAKELFNRDNSDAMRLLSASTAKFNGPDSIMKVRAAATTLFEELLGGFCRMSPFMIDGRDVEYTQMHFFVKLTLDAMCDDLMMAQKEEFKSNPANVNKYLSSKEVRMVIDEVNIMYVAFFSKRRHLLIQPFYVGPIRSASNLQGQVLINVYIGDSGH